MSERRIRLQTARKRKDITQKEMAKRLNISNSSYWKKEKGDKEFLCSEMICIAKELNESLDYLFMVEEEDND
ncbi:helix-turn-helix domain-containing protein [Staphylococcus pettenkoferi]|uniref:Helix-turn-helix domain-containing protein n=1 Tax=Staphylococcus pettenkoferi TaxID=170573 RepID=A0ABT4BL40_9STAP|nr:helix-turn-helix transcriptional regulator [Staphylococcus pettenkoferi]MCY1563867.1 helix-turn-helix domain-containing protein [Staphylococcus pettenkoferi]MCY1583303.1 helix-turn-helix domain-containing protein [Staphylococcus pettenkoferi]